MKKRILVTGGSHSEIPLIEAAKSAGAYIITTGYNHDGLGHKLADEYIPGDFSDKEFILQLAKNKQVQAIISGCNDFAYLSTAYACDALGLPGHDSYETAQVIHHKNSFRQMTESLGIRTPRLFKCYEEIDLVKACNSILFPIVIKPVDLTGGKGVCICWNLEEAKNAFTIAKKCTKKNFVIAEEYVIGTNHGTSMLLKAQKVVGGVFDDEQYYLNQYLVAGASMPSIHVTQAAMFQLIHDIEKIARHLNLTDGLFHTQFIIEKNGFPVIIDPCRRTPGDFYVLLAQYVTSINYPAEIVKAESGLPLQESYYQSSYFYARECIMTDKPGIIKDIHVDSRITTYITYSMIWGKRGDLITDVLKYKAGILIMKFKSIAEMQKILEHYHELVTIEIK